MNLRKKIFFSHLLFFLIISSAFIWSRLFYYFIIVFNVFLFSFLILFFRKDLWNRDKFLLPLLPFFFLNSFLFFLSISVPSFYFIFFILIAIILSYCYCLNLKKRKFTSLLVWSDIISLLSVFLASSFFYSLNYFLNINPVWVFLFLSIFIFLIAGLNISLLSQPRSLSVFFLIIFLLSLIPLIWSFFFLPFNYNIIALLLSVLYYAGLSFIRLYLNRDLGPKKIKYNLIFIISLMILILLSVKWR